MNISCSREPFLHAVSTLARIPTTRSSIQALSGILFRADSEGLTLKATDLEISLQMKIGAEIQNEGEFVLPGRLVADIAKSLAGETVELNLDGGVLTLKSGGASFTLRLIPSEDFPKIPDLGEGQITALEPQVFVDTVDWVVRSASHDETRPILTSVQMTISQQMLRMVATDSYRLSVKEASLTGEGKGEFEANVPARALQELTRLAGASDAKELKIAIREGQIVFQLGSVNMVSRLMDGQFPNHSQLIPDSFEHELKIEGPEFHGVVKRIGLMAQKNTPLKLSFRAGEVEVSAQTPDVGAASETIPVPFEGDELEIGFNADFLREGLEGTRSSSIVFKLISSLRPALIESAEAEGFTCLIMPVRLNS